MKTIKAILFTLILILMITEVKSQTEKDVNDAQGLLPGVPSPIFKALDADSVEFSLEEALETGPVVIIFYRGFWCPVCNEHLETLQDSLQFIQDQGVRVIAVSPEKPEYLGKMAENTGARFTLLYDEDYRIADAYDLSFKPGTMQLFTYNVVLGAKLKETHSDKSQRLPIPATYIVDQQGLIVWRHFNPDYKNRASVNDILNALKERLVLE